MLKLVKRLIVYFSALVKLLSLSKCILDSNLLAY